MKKRDQIDRIKQILSRQIESEEAPLSRQRADLGLSIRMLRYDDQNNQLMSLGELAKKAGMTERKLGNVETGKSVLDEAGMQKIFDALGINESIAAPIWSLHKKLWDMIPANQRTITQR